MPSARFEGAIPVAGTWQECVDYILAQFDNPQNTADCYFWRLSAQNEDSVCGDTPRDVFEAMAEDGEAARLLVEFSGAGRQ